MARRHIAIRVSKVNKGMDKLSYMIEVCEWFDWMQFQIKKGSILSLSQEMCVLITAKAIRRVNALEPQYWGSLRRRVRARLIRAHIVYQCWGQGHCHTTDRRIIQPDGSRHLVAASVTVPKKGST